MPAMGFGSTLKGRVAIGALALALIGILTWLWQRTQSLNLEDHAHIDAALRELRSADRTINQDVLRARYQLVNSYGAVLRNYRRMEELEAMIATPPRYLNAEASGKLAAAVANYRSSVTNKQGLIERFKYRTADLRELLAYLPTAGTSAARAAAEEGNDQLAALVNESMQLTLLYNLTSGDQYVQEIRRSLDDLAEVASHTQSPRLKRRLGTLELNIRRLLEVKPAVDGLLRRIFDEPVVEQEENVANIYYAGYAAAEHVARQYRVILYGFCVGLLGLIGLGVRNIQRSARALAVSNERLEERVAERTRQLDARNHATSVVLDNVDQALFTVDSEGRLSGERSAAFERWFPQATPGALLWDLFETVDPQAATWLTLGWDQLHGGCLPRDVALDQLPRSLSDAVNGRSYKVEYRPIGEESESVSRILLVISDVTEAFEVARREADQKEQMIIFQHVMKDSHEFDEFFTESERLIDGLLKGKVTDLATAIRSLHTLKGNCSMYGVTSVAQLCHDLESKLIDTKKMLDPIDRLQLNDVWSAFARKVRSLTGSVAEDRVELARAELDSLHRAVADGAEAGDLLQRLRRLELEPAERRLSRLAEQARRLGLRLGKGEIDVAIEPNDVRLDPKRWAPFWSAFVHMLRNALDHGIEPTEERLACGKPAVGRLWLRTRRTDDRILVEISDDGRGVDWDAVRATAREQGLAAETEDELTAVLFRGGVSTKAVVTEYSGRGSGVSACYTACRELGGSLSVVSKAGVGATFRFSIPAQEPAQSLLTSAA
jgi:HPt (histidine-containing phosphotransfer) domain-containing protein